jgi:hypothetical protein
LTNDLVKVLNVRAKQLPLLVNWLNSLPAIGSGVVKRPGRKVISGAAFERLLEVAPCLYAQVLERPSAKGIVHLTELTVGSSVSSKNIMRCFQIQHPRLKKHPERYKFPPAITKDGPGPGDITEALCSELLSNNDLPLMRKQPDGFPVWASKSHISLNDGKMSPLKLYGDLMIPAAPHNILISVKTEGARERLLVSGNRLESVGFGFFDRPEEFWTPNRINLFKRWGFMAIYMPVDTLNAIENKLKLERRTHENTNINGRKLFRSLEDFAPDMYRIAGRLTIEL